jgi:hypothetical protein
MMVPSMTPQEWASRTQQQWEHVARYRGPPPPGFAATPASLVAVSDPRTNGAAIVSLAVGVLAFSAAVSADAASRARVGAAAVVSGIVGWSVPMKSGRGQRMCAGRILLGLLAVLIALG